LANEAEYKFDFTQAINISHKDENLYASLSHLIWIKMIKNAQNENSFNTFNTFHWLTVITLILSIGNAIVLVLLYLRYKSISLLLLSLPKINGQCIYETSTSRKADQTQYVFK